MQQNHLLLKRSYIIERFWCLYECMNPIWACNESCAAVALISILGFWWGERKDALAELWGRLVKRAISWAHQSRRWMWSWSAYTERQCTWWCPVDTCRWKRWTLAKECYIAHKEDVELQKHLGVLAAIDIEGGFSCARDFFTESPYYEPAIAMLE